MLTRARTTSVVVLLFTVFILAVFIGSVTSTTTLQGNIRHEFETKIRHAPLRFSRVLVDTAGATPLSVLSGTGSFESLAQKMNGDDVFATLSEGFTPLSALSTQEFTFTSNTPPESAHAKDFLPFGRVMTVEFEFTPAMIGDVKTASIGSLQIDEEFTLTSLKSMQQQQQQDSTVDTSDDGVNNNRFAFVLEVDQNLVSADPAFPSISKVQKPVSNNNNNNNDNSIQQQTVEYEEYYSKHTTFKGKRINTLGQEETLIVSITPTTKQNVVKTENGLETQQVDSSTTNGDDSYTMEAVLWAGDGKLYHITTYQRLMEDMKFYEYQQELLLQEQEEKYNNGEVVDEVERYKIQSNFNILSQSMSVLMETRTLTDDGDYLIREIVPIESKCGNSEDHDHSHDDDVNDDNNVLSIQPSWRLTKWASTCHPRMSTMTVFTQTFIFTTNYRLWASGTTTESSISNAKVEARTKLLQSIINQITDSQTSTITQLTEMIHLPSTNTSDINPPTCASGSLSQIQSALSNARSKNLNTAMIQALMGCYEASGLAGLNTLGNLGRTYGAGVSGITSISSYQTLAHEAQGHGYNAPHPFTSSTDQGSYGSIMDYGSAALKAPDTDEGFIGFSSNLHGNAMCTTITNAIAAVGSSYIPKAKIWREPTTLWSSACSNDGMRKPWEQCQGNNACCNNCQFVQSTATCSTPHPECCVNCQVPNVPTLCTIDGIAGAGTCNKQGECQKWSNPSCGQSTNAVCSIAMTFQWNGRYQICQKMCPMGSTCSGTFGIDSYDLYDNCYYKPDGSNNFDVGMCIADKTNGGMKCVSKTIAQQTAKYTWSYTILQALDCNAMPSIPLIDSYVCYDPAGNPVGDEYCSNITKPTRANPSSCTSRVADVTSPTTTSPNGKGLDLGETFTVRWAFSQGATSTTGSDDTIGELVLLYNGVQKLSLMKNIQLKDKSIQITLPNDITLLPSTNNAAFRILYGAGLYSTSPSFNIWSYQYQADTTWSTCSTTYCGNGIQTRNQLCKRINDNLTVQDIKCQNYPNTTPINNTELIRSSTGPTTCSPTGGNCINNQCVCNKGYLGTTCSTQDTLNPPMCTSTNCPIAKGGVCNIDTQECQCTTPDQWFGPRCAGNTICTKQDLTDTGDNKSKCANGGYFTTEPNQTTNECPKSTTAQQKCTCINNWISNDTFTMHTAEQQGCTICNLQCNQDKNYGKAIDNCSRCQCNSESLWSTNCQCRQIQLEFKLTNYPNMFNNNKNINTKTNFIKFVQQQQQDDNDNNNNNNNNNQEIIKQVSEYISLIEASLYTALITESKHNINRLRFNIDDWSVNTKSKILNIFINFKTKCNADRSITNFSGITDTRHKGTTDIIITTDAEELYYLTSILLNVINQYEFDSIDNYGLKYLNYNNNQQQQQFVSLFRNNNKPLLLNDVIIDPSCKMLGDVEGYQCGIKQGRGESNNAMMISSSSSFIAIVLVIIFILF